MRLRIGLLGAVIGVAGLVSLAPERAEGADHTDPPGLAEPLADIADFYAWMDTGAENLNLITTVAPLDGATAFSTAVQYGFHVSSRADFGATDETLTQVVCQFYDTDAIECWVLAADGSVVDYVEGDPTDEAGLQSESGDVTVFAGSRNDPFYFNQSGFNATVAAVVEAAGGLTFDEGNCPAVDSDTSAALVGLLQTDGAAEDDLADSNVLALVVQVDKTLVNGGGDLLAAWASTNMAP